MSHLPHQVDCAELALSQVLQHFEVIKPHLLPVDAAVYLLLQGFAGFSRNCVLQRLALAQQQLAHPAHLLLLPLPTLYPLLLLHQLMLLPRLLLLLTLSVADVVGCFALIFVLLL